LIYEGDKCGNSVPDRDDIGIRHLHGDGDFRSQECIDILKEADIVVTNPPFSLFREFVAQLYKYGKKFLIIGHQNAITYKEGMIRVSGVTWFTNLEIKKRHEDMILYRSYKGNEESYPFYDNYDAINIDLAKNVPADYAGVMGVPITFLSKHNPDQFDLVGQMVTTKIDEFNHGYPYINGKKIYARILIKNKRIQTK
jgi:hypothetical protein